MRFKVNRAELDAAAAKLPTPPASERPWLTAEAFTPAGPTPSVAEQGPPPGSRPPPAAASHAAAPEGPPSRRRPRRRRWLPPTSLTERQQEPVDPPRPLFRCPACGRNHQPFPFHTGGLSAAYGRVLDPADDPHSTRPRPLGRGPYDPAPLLRDQVNAWRHGTPDPPPPSPYVAEIRAELHARAAQPGPAPAERPAGVRMLALDVARRIARSGRLPPWWPWHG